MCGILGVIGSSPDLTWAKEELSALKHRGPDSQGLMQINNQLILGATRLAMTDPNPRSNQPLKDEETGSWIVFNGEIYNFESLKNELIQSGVFFATRGDTEVLLKGLGKYGSTFLQRINGMYAFAYFDAPTGLLTLGRDHLGKKPLYYLINDHNLYFSSSQTSFQKLDKKAMSDQGSLISYLTLGYVLDPNTMHNQVKSLQPGHTLKTKLGAVSALNISKTIEDKAYFSKNILAETLTSAVESRIHGHYEVGISLSGGYDSTLIAILLSKSDVKVRSYSAVWKDSDKAKYNLDAQAARRTSEKLGFEHREIEIFDSSELPLMLNRYLVALQEPNNNSTGLSMMNVYEAAKKDDLRLMLTGDGADELLGGYSRYEQFARVPNILNLSTRAFDSFVVNNHTNHLAKFISAQLNSSNFAKWIPWQMVFSPNELVELIPGMKEKEVIQTLLGLTTNLVQYNSRSGLANFMDFDLQTWLTMESNRRLDRVSMTYSIEARSPFQDTFFMQAAKHQMEQKRYKEMKREILTSNFEELNDFDFPKEKAGFISPIGHWLRNNPKLIGESLSFLEKSEGFRRSQLERLSTSPERGDFRSMVKLWTLIVYSQWKLLNEA